MRNYLKKIVTTNLFFSFLIFSHCILEENTGNTTGSTTNNQPTVVEPPAKEEKKQENTSSFDYYPVSSRKNITKHTYYAFAYSEEHGQAEWVAYELTADRLAGDGVERGNFRTDPTFPAESAVKSSDYTKTGYDRGHLLPAADMSFSEQAMDECFYMTNISPQEPSFNRGIWKSLEEQVRDWARSKGKLYVVTGPVLTQKVKARFSQEQNSIAVPHSFYKALLFYDGKTARAIGFWLKNEESKEQLSNFAISIDELEAVTKIDFFPALPDKLEAAVEASFDVETDWQF